MSEVKGLKGKVEKNDTSFGNIDAALVHTEPDNLVLKTNLEIELQVETMIEKNEGLWQCKVCWKTLNHKGKIKQHAETHIKGVALNCHVCNKTCSTRNALRTHINDYHSDLSFNCNICSQSGMTKNAFKHHKRNCK